jgi:uncharacterized protein YjbI with pentapeptide repeats
MSRTTTSNQKVIKGLILSAEPESNQGNQELEPPRLLADAVAATAKNAGRALAVYALFWVCWILTILGNSDRRLIFDRVVFLPVVHLGVPLDVFFVLSPVVAVLIFLYPQFYFHKLQALLDILRTNYAGAGRVSLLPWIAAAAVNPEPGPMGGGLRIFARLALWTSLPLALIINVLKFIRVHEPVWSFVVGGLTVGGTIVVYLFWRQSLAFRPHTSLYLKVVRHLGFASLFVGEAVILICLIPWSHAGYLPPALAPNFVGKFVSSLVFADLNNVQLIPQVNEDGERNQVQRDFRGVHLEGAFLFRANLSRSSFQGAFFRCAQMDQAHLEGTSFEFANLIQAHMNFADLQRADLRQAVLTGAWLMGANLKEADLRHAFLPYLFLQYADARGADFSLADISNAILFDSNLQGAHLRGASLQASRVQRVDFGQADLRDVNFTGSNLWESKFRGANLAGANFTNVFNLSVEQLSEAKTLYNARLAPELYRQVKEKFPRILEKPVGEDGS